MYIHTHILQVEVLYFIFVCVFAIDLCTLTLIMNANLFRNRELRIIQVRSDTK